MNIVDGENRMPINTGQVKLSDVIYMMYRPAYRAYAIMKAYYHD